MTRKYIAQLRADLGATRSFSGPRVRDDNSFPEAQIKILKCPPEASTKGKMAPKMEKTSVSKSLTGFSGPMALPFVWPFGHASRRGLLWPLLTSRTADVTA